MADLFRSERLIYRALELDQDEDFILAIQQDVAGYRNGNVRIARPQSRQDAKNVMKKLNECLLMVVICLPPSVNDAAAAESAGADPKDAKKLVPIGTIHLESMPSYHAQHRFTDIGVDILPEYQRKGYGGEAIRWVLRWAFNTAGMHRVGISAFEWNEGAWKLYKRLGFREEGRGKEMFFYEGRWWDDVRFGMLDYEWRAMQAQEKSQTDRA